MTTCAVSRENAAVLVDRRRAGAYTVLTVQAPEIVSGARPGQFVSIGVQAQHTLLRRPFAIAGVDAAAGTLQVVIAVVGHGSRWLANQPAAAALDVVGPLGRGFVLPSVATRCVLVGGGYGTAPLGWLGQQLLVAGHQVELLSGAASAGALYPVSRVMAAAGVAIETTEDGSRGRTGLVTDVLEARLAQPSPAVVYACGPMPMLAAVAEIARRHDVACQVAVEEHMGCAVGVCMTCVVPTHGGYLRACVDGPVLDAQRVDWGVGGSPSFRTASPSTLQGAP